MEKAGYTYGYTQQYGRDAWYWHANEAPLLRRASTEQEVIRKICEHAKARGVEPVIRDISVVRPVKERTQQIECLGLSM
jgi:predicted small metal-binding protein